MNPINLTGLNSYAPVANSAMEIVNQQRYQFPASQQAISNPYNDLKQELSTMDEEVKNLVINDMNYIDLDNIIDNIIKSSLYDSVIPQLLQNASVRSEFERWLLVTRQLRSHYEKEVKGKREDYARKQERLMSYYEDDVIKERIATLESGGNNRV